MNKNISLSSVSINKYIQPFTRFHYLIFIVLVLGGVAFTVYKINVILNLPTDQNYRNEKEKVLLNDNFDQVTIDKLKQLNYSSNLQPINLPSGRNNPFVE